VHAMEAQARASEAFSLFVRGGRSACTKVEFRQVIRHLAGADAAAADAAFAHLDADRSGSVELAAFAASAELRTVHAWTRADAHQRGFLTRAGLGGGCQAGFGLLCRELCGAALPEPELQQLYAILDRRRLERVDLKEVLEREFCAFLACYLVAREASSPEALPALLPAGVGADGLWGPLGLDVVALGRKWQLAREQHRYFTLTERGQRQAGHTDMTLRRRGSGSSFADSATQAHAVLRAVAAFKAKTSSGAVTPSTEFLSRSPSRSPELTPRGSPEPRTVE